MSFDIVVSGFATASHGPATRPRLKRIATICKAMTDERLARHWPGDVFVTSRASFQRFLNSDSSSCLLTMFATN